MNLLSFRGEGEGSEIKKKIYSVHSSKTKSEILVTSFMDEPLICKVVGCKPCYTHYTHCHELTNFCFLLSGKTDKKVWIFLTLCNLTQNSVLLETRP